MFSSTRASGLPTPSTPVLPTFYQLLPRLGPCRSLRGRKNSNRRSPGVSPGLHDPQQLLGQFVFRNPASIRCSHRYAVKLRRKVHDACVGVLLDVQINFLLLPISRSHRPRFPRSGKRSSRSSRMTVSSIKIFLAVLREKKARD